MSFSIDPHKLDSEWIKIADEMLARPLLTEQYKKRLKRIKKEAINAIGKQGTISNHYPHERK